MQTKMMYSVTIQLLRSGMQICDNTYRAHSYKEIVVKRYLNGI